jgi:hypothetical protein
VVSMAAMLAPLFPASSPIFYRLSHGREIRARGWL